MPFHSFAVLALVSLATSTARAEAPRDQSPPFAITTCDERLALRPPVPPLDTVRIEVTDGAAERWTEEGLSATAIETALRASVREPMMIGTRGLESRFLAFVESPGRRDVWRVEFGWRDDVILVDDVRAYDEGADAAEVDRFERTALVRGTPSPSRPSASDAPPSRASIW